ncbi:Xaa-Pro peptidase family protein [Fictibacillus sp. Mic-4]|uniref:M24 family metallopeptidase n=1 Tax=Fictibacillus TaxID=1329200 RepID=UPI000421CB25|nr:Xaa-Pro peptidase family protein [Fictibacillus gelatini]
MQRLEKLRYEFKEFGIDGILIASLSNRKYISGFTGTAGVLVISEKEAKLITDFRYMDQAKEQAKEFDIVLHTSSVPIEVAKVAHELGITRLGFEQEYLTYSEYRTYENELSGINATFVPTSGIVEKLRLIKDSQEIKILKEAAEIADSAFSHITNFIKPGISELDVRNELEFVMRKNGATSSSFNTIVASGYRSALPHGVASDKIIQEGELVTLDFGAYYKGYCSDITRTVAVGQVSEELKAIYDVVYEAQLNGVEKIKPGITGREADALTRDIIAQKGYGDYFGHSTGHGIGLEVHEGPSLSAKSDMVLKPGMVVTVEPGIYISGLGGVRIEDDILITKDGNEILTHSRKDLIILGD